MNHSRTDYLFEQPYRANSISKPLEVRGKYKFSFNLVKWIRVLAQVSVRADVCGEMQG